MWASFDSHQGRVHRVGVTDPPGAGFTGSSQPVRHQHPRILHTWRGIQKRSKPRISSTCSTTAVFSCKRALRPCIHADCARSGTGISHPHLTICEIQFYIYIWADWNFLAIQFKCTRWTGTVPPDECNAMQCARQTWNFPVCEMQFYICQYAAGISLPTMLLQAMVLVFDRKTLFPQCKSDAVNLGVEIHVGWRAQSRSLPAKVVINFHADRHLWIKPGPRNFPVFFSDFPGILFQKSVLNAEARKQASKPESQQASQQASKEASKQASKPASQQASKWASKQASQPASQQASKPGSQPASQQTSKERQGKGGYIF